MSWWDVRGHGEVAQKFAQATRRGRLASSFLFVGPPGVGKRTFAFKLAQTLLCEGGGEANFEPCGTCPACRQVAAGTHPDLLTVQRPEEKSNIPLELFIGSKEKRMRVGLCHDIGLKPFRGRRRVAIIDDADDLNAEGANCLLKTLEEPPPNSLLILISTSEQRQLPTIRSRCQIVRFQPLAPEDVRELLLAKEIVADEALAGQVARLAGGSLQRANDLADEELREFQPSLVSFLSQRKADRYAFAKSLIAFVEAAGTEPKARRARLKQIFRLADDFYGELLRHVCGAANAGESPVREAARRAANEFSRSAEAAAAGLERCLDAQWQTDANANLTTLIECWVDDLALARLATPG